MVARRNVEESRGKETTIAEVRKYTFRKSQEKNKRTVQGKDQEVKRSAREDKRYWMNEMADIAERASENGRAGKLHRIVKTLTGEKKRTSTVLNDKNGKPTNERSERLKIWKEHLTQY